MDKRHLKLLAERRALRRALAAAPVTEVLGVVAPSAPGGGMLRGEREYLFSVELKPWRVMDGEIEKRPLILSQWVGEQAISSRMESFKVGSLVRARVRLAPASDKAARDALLIKQSSRAADRELAKLAKVVNAPSRRRVQRLGLLTFNHQTNWWDGRIAWRGAVRNRADIAVPAGLKDEPRFIDGVRTARRLVVGRYWEKRLRTFAAKKLLKLANDWARQDNPDAKPIDDKDFINRMRTESITAMAKGAFEWWFDDGDLFFGHAIVVKGTIARGPGRASIEG